MESMKRELLRLAYQVEIALYGQEEWERRMARRFTQRMQGVTEAMNRMISATDHCRRALAILPLPDSAAR